MQYPRRESLSTHRILSLNFLALDVEKDASFRRISEPSLELAHRSQILREELDQLVVSESAKLATCISNSVQGPNSPSLILLQIVRILQIRSPSHPTMMHGAIGLDLTDFARLTEDLLIFPHNGSVFAIGSKDNVRNRDLFSVRFVKKSV